MGAKKGGTKKSYYEAQHYRTVANKLRLKKRRERNLEKWIKAGVNKKGKPVLNKEDREVRLKSRKELRKKRLAEMPRPTYNHAYRGNSGNTRRPRVPQAED